MITSAYCSPPCISVRINNYYLVLTAAPDKLTANCQLKTCLPTGRLQTEKWKCTTTPTCITKKQIDKEYNLRDD